MKLVTAFSTVALVLAPAVGLAQAPANSPGDTIDESGLKSKIEQAIGKVTGRSSETKVGEKTGDQNSAASAGETNYPDRGAVKRTDKTDK